MMNERIVKLMMQAANDIAPVIRESEIDYDRDYAELAHFLASDKNNRIFNAFKQKFAELIVRECVSVIQEELDSGQYSQPVHTGFRVSKNTIKEHFGVEE